MNDRKPYKSDLSDERWALIEPVIAAWKADHPSPTGHQGRYEIREIVNAILYQGRTGCQWDYLPHDLPPKSAVYYYFGAWRDDGTDVKINDLLRWQVREKAGRAEDPTLVVIDTQSVHAAVNVPAATTGKDAAKKVPGRKRGLAVDVLGLVIAVTVLAASAHDNAFGIALLGQVAPIGTIKKALVDQGFKKTVAEHGTTVGIDVEIVERNPSDKGSGFVPQAKRWIVEQTLGILMLFRRLVRDYESKPKSSESRVRWAMRAGSPARPRPPGAGDCVDAQVTPLLERIDARERELGTAAEQLRTQIDELAARLRGVDEEIGNLVVTRKTLLALPPTAPESTDPLPAVPAHPAYQQILDAFADTAGPMRARDLCERLDLAVTPKNIESTRHKLKRLVGLGVLTEREPGLFAQRRPSNSVTPQHQPT